MTVTASTPDGTRYTVTVEPAPMLVGVTCHTTELVTHRQAFPRAKFCRVFAGPGEGLPSWSHPKLSWLPVGWRPWVSFKDWPNPRVLHDWLDRVSGPTMLTWEHERDNNAGEVAQSRTARAAYQARWRDLMGMLDAHPNRPNITAMPIQTLQWTTATSRAGVLKGDGDWRPWWAGVGDGAAMDCYVDSWAGKYPDPERWLRPAFELAEGTGRRLWIPELGSVLQGNDTGVGRAAWIRDVADLLRERNCAGVAWWCTVGKAGSKGEIRDFHLSDLPSAEAWRAAIDRSAA